MPANDIPLGNMQRDFPLLFSKEKPYIYLDSAATSHKPLCVIQAMHDFYAYENATVHRTIYEQGNRATAKYEGTREKIAKWLSATSSNEIIFTSGTTESLNLVAKCFAKAFIEPGDEILVSIAEHHSNLVPWQVIAQEYQAKLKFIPLHETGEFDLKEYKALLSDKTKIVSVAHMTNTSGVVFPIKEIVEYAHAVGAKVCVDGAQAISHTEVSLKDLDVDFYAFSAHKMYGPTGLGVLYGKLDLLNAMPPYNYGGDMIKGVTLNETTFQQAPLRFEAGTPKIAQVIGLNRAIDYILEYGMQNIAVHEAQLMQYAVKKLKAIPEIQILGDINEKGPIITFNLLGAHPLDIATYLSTKHIAVRSGHMCAQPSLQHFQTEYALRISFGIYNTKNDVDVLVEAIEEFVILLK